MNLSITGEYFEELAKGSNDAQITVKLGIELLPTTAATYDADGNYLEERDATVPKFTYKLTSAVSYPKGNLEGNIHDFDSELLPDGRGGYVVQERPQRQERMW